MKSRIGTRIIQVMSAGILAHSILFVSFPDPCRAGSCPLPFDDDAEKSKTVSGSITEKDLYLEFPEWEELSARYKPKPEIIKQLRKITTPFDIMLFLGTWCGNANNALPAFLKVYSSTNNPAFSLRILVVDRKIREKSGLAEKLRIDKAPTIVFLHKGKESGRIVVKPEHSMEEDFLSVVTREPPT